MAEIYVDSRAGRQHATCLGQGLPIAIASCAIADGSNLPSLTSLEFGPRHFSGRSLCRPVVGLLMVGCDAGLIIVKEWPNDM